MRPYVMSQLLIPLDFKYNEFASSSGSAIVSVRGYKFVRLNFTSSLMPSVRIDSGTIVRWGTPQMNGKTITLNIYPRDNGAEEFPSTYYPLLINIDVVDKPIGIVKLCYNVSSKVWTTSFGHFTGEIVSA